MGVHGLGLLSENTPGGAVLGTMVGTTAFTAVSVAQFLRRQDERLNVWQVGDA